MNAGMRGGMSAGRLPLAVTGAGAGLGVAAGGRGQALLVGERLGGAVGEVGAAVRVADAGQGRRRMAAARRGAPLRLPALAGRRGRLPAGLPPRAPAAGPRLRTAGCPLGAGGGLGARPADGGDGGGGRLAPRGGGAAGEAARRRQEPRGGLVHARVRRRGRPGGEAGGLGGRGRRLGGGAGVQVLEEGSGGRRGAVQPLLLGVRVVVAGRRRRRPQRVAGPRAGAVQRLHSAGRGRRGGSGGRGGSRRRQERRSPRGAATGRAASSSLPARSLITSVSPSHSPHTFLSRSPSSCPPTPTFSSSSPLSPEH